MARSLMTRNDQRGFTLLEALVAITILAFGLLAVVTMLDVSFSASTLSKNTTKATELAAWMVDRVRQDTSLATQPYTASNVSLQTYMNVMLTPAKRGFLTNLAADPPNEPGRTACQQWRALIQGAAIANYIGADTMRGNRLSNGIGQLGITLNDPNNGGNHLIEVIVSWDLPGSRGLFTKSVQLETVLAVSN